MAVGGLEVEIVAGGVSEQPAERGRWAQNVWVRKGRMDWETRPGFGQLCVYNSTLDTPGALAASPTVYGYEEHLGSASVPTSFGATHIVSVFRLKAQTGNSNIGRVSQWSSLYAVSIVDADTGDRWEEILHTHTAAFKNGPVPQNKWHGVYETNEDLDTQNFLFGTSDRFYFHVFDNTLFFGNNRTGVLSYFPTDFRKSRRKTVDSNHDQNNVKGYSESSLVNTLVPVDGLYPESYNYLQADDLPPPVAISSVQNILVWAGEHEIYFSEPAAPNAFIDKNFVIVPSQNPVTAVESILDNLLVYTATETFLYQPSVGDLSSLGRFVTVSTTIGCLSPLAVTQQEGAVSWCDQNGVYATSNGMQIQPISEAIHEFFGDGITCPLNHYLTANGVTDVSTRAQPRTLLKFRPDDMVSLQFWTKESQLLLCSPSNNVVWCLSKGDWSVWTVESCVAESGAASVVEAKNNILSPFVVVGDSRLFCVGGLDEDTVIDGATGTGQKNAAYYLLESGRGGGLDRSSEYEFNQSVSNYYQGHGFTTLVDDCRFYFDEPQLDPVSGDLFQLISVMQNPATGWSTPPQSVDLQFTFKHEDWSLREDPAIAGDLYLALPTERLASAGSIVNKTVNNATGAVRLTITTPPLAPLEIGIGKKGPLFILRWQRDNTNPKLNFGITITSATVVGTSFTKDARALIWNQYNAPAPSPDSKAQAVDWAYKSEQIGESGATQVKARGLFSRFISHGSASNPLSPNWLWGLFNVLSASDWKGWSSQVVDFTGETPAIETIANKRTIRTRFKNTSGALATRTFDGEPKYGEYLVDDEEYDTISISDSARGEHLTYMIFGFIRDKAEKLVIGSSKALLRPNQGSRRRTGR